MNGRSNKNASVTLRWLVAVSSANPPAHLYSVRFFFPFFSLPFPVFFLSGSSFSCPKYRPFLRRLFSPASTKGPAIIYLPTLLKCRLSDSGLVRASTRWISAMHLIDVYLPRAYRQVLSVIEEIRWQFQFELSLELSSSEISPRSSFSFRGAFSPSLAVDIGRPFRWASSIASYLNLSTEGNHITSSAGPAIYSVAQRKVNYVESPLTTWFTPGIRPGLLYESNPSMGISTDGGRNRKSITSLIHFVDRSLWITAARRLVVVISRARVPLGSLT